MAKTFRNLSTDTTLGGNAPSDSTVSSQKAIKAYVDTKATGTNRINGAPLSNSSSIFYGVSTSAAKAVEKVVSIPSITTLEVGVAILVQPTVTSSVANSTLKLNNFPAYPMIYIGAAITTSTDSVVWSAAFPSWWLFDGTSWVFSGKGYDTTYSSRSVAAGIEGTETSSRLLRADRLKPIIQGTTLTDIDVSTTGAVTASDSITSGIGKLQATKADSSALSGKQEKSNLVTSVSAASTDAQYPSAKLFYTTCGNIEALINAL